jgi:hypothetical protein
LKRSSIAVPVILAACLASFSCYSAPPSSQITTSKLKFRAFVSNPLQPGLGGSGVPVLNIVDASKDVLSTFTISMGSGNPNLMTVTPNKRLTLVFNDGINTLSLIDNITEAPLATAAGAALPAIQIAGPAPSIIAGTDNATGYAAVPSAPILGQDPGAVQIFSLNQAKVLATLPVPNVQGLAISHLGTRVLAFGGNTCSDGTYPVVVIAPSLVGSNDDPRTFVCGFDHPVGGVFSSDDTTAFIFECGPLCHGTAGAVVVLDMNSNTIVTSIPVPAATTGLLSGNTLYIAGTLPGTPCGGNTASTSCGNLTLIDTNSLSIKNTSPILIADGMQTKIAMGANAQLFIGSQNCTNINAGGEIRGCLTIFNTQNSGVVVPPVNGDVTGMAAINNRDVFYVTQNTELYIYDTNTDALQSTQIDIIGQANDVVLVDTSSQ